MQCPQISDEKKKKFCPFDKKMSTPSFGSHLNPISTRGANYAHPIYWCPHQVLKATDAPDFNTSHLEAHVAFFECL